MCLSYAQVSIKLRNRGQDAYKPDDYGESITVERRISSDGSGSYKLKSHDGTEINNYQAHFCYHKQGLTNIFEIFFVSGKLISQKKDELNHILDQFNIQVNWNWDFT